MMRNLGTCGVVPETLICLRTVESVWQACAELRVHALDICVKSQYNAALLLTRDRLLLGGCRPARLRINAIKDRRLCGVAGTHRRLLSAWRQLDLTDSAETHAVAEAACQLRRPAVKLATGPASVQEIRVCKGC